MKFVMYGAGSIGRGFIGPLFNQAGYEVVYIDVDENIILALNQYGKYTVHIAMEQLTQFVVDGVRGVSGKDELAVIQEIVSCDLMATALGAAVLPVVAPLISQGIRERNAKSGKPLDLILCENLKDAAARMREWLSENFGPDNQELLKQIGLVEAAIGKMVPLAEKEQKNPLDILVEEYNYLPVDRAAFLGLIPDIPQLVPYTPFAYYEERKLYLHNMGHAMCAFLGIFRGHVYINQAINDPLIRLVVQNGMTEAAIMLSRKYDTSFPELYRHMQNLIYRFGNKELKDTCVRVARDPMRKLAADDRMAGAYRECVKAGIMPVFIGLGIAVILMQQSRQPDQCRDVLRNVCRLPEEHMQQIEAMMNQLDKSGLQGALEMAEHLGNTLAGSVV